MSFARAEEDLQRSYFARLPPGGLLFCCAMLVLFIGVADYLSGQFSSDLFYLVPIALEAWHGGRRRGQLLAALAAACWLLVHIQERDELPALVRLWNGTVRLAFFLIAAALLARLRAALAREEALARFDALTGALNRRFFYLLAQREILRARRHGQPLTIAYLDLDDFKQVNDRQGHAAGDELLRRFAELVRDRIRATDLFARLGGDEFALLLLETSAAGGRQALEKLQQLFAEQFNPTPVTFSIGAITFAADLPDIEDMIQRADALMYRIKQSGKNGIEYQVVSEAADTAPPER